MSDIDMDKNFLAVSIKHEHLERYKLNCTEAGEFSVLGKIWKGNIKNIFSMHRQQRTVQKQADKKLV